MLPYLDRHRQGWTLILSGKDVSSAKIDCEHSSTCSWLKNWLSFWIGENDVSTSQFHWRYGDMVQDVRNYAKGCMRCQKFKYSRPKSLTDPHLLEKPHRQWGSVVKYFSTHLPKNKGGYDCITTWVDQTSRRVNFIFSKSSYASSVDLQNLLWKCFKAAWITGWHCLESRSEVHIKGLAWIYAILSSKYRPDVTRRLMVLLR
jgi:hypothetical protein